MNNATHPGTDALRWEAVASRDTRFDSTFFYGVNSTHIYCRPSCPSRRPRRDRVVFFESPEIAESLGYRSCKRCKPRETALRDAGAELVLKVCGLIDAATDTTLSLEELGTKIGVSPHHLQRTFKEITGITPHQYAAALRLNQFKTRVREGADITTAMYDAGYGSSSRLYEKAGERMGMTPASYRRGGKDMNINYTIATSRLGRLLVAATDRGVCSVQFGNSDDDLTTALKAEYPAATIISGDATLKDHVAAILAHIDGKQ
ncbi:MAG: Ada metal-binding domain-containing protein, partial [Acidobacteriota bacterium]